VLPISPTDVAFLALRRGPDGARDASTAAPSGSADLSTSFRMLVPDAARLYLSHGILQGENPPGGSGERARSIEADGVNLASSGGPIMDFSRLSPSVKRPEPTEERPRDEEPGVANEPADEPIATLDVSWMKRARSLRRYRQISQESVAQPAPGSQRAQATSTYGRIAQLQGSDQDKDPLPPSPRSR